jgi:adenylosuccinate lyase
MAKKQNTIISQRIRGYLRMVNSFMIYLWVTEVLRRVGLQQPVLWLKFGDARHDSVNKS